MFKKFHEFDTYLAKIQPKSNTCSDELLPRVYVPEFFLESFNIHSFSSIKRYVDGFNNHESFKRFIISIFSDNYTGLHFFQNYRREEDVNKICFLSVLKTFFSFTAENNMKYILEHILTEKEIVNFSYFIKRKLLHKNVNKTINKCWTPLSIIFFSKRINIDHYKFMLTVLEHLNSVDLYLFLKKYDSFTEKPQFDEKQKENIRNDIRRYKYFVMRIYVSDIEPRSYFVNIFS